MVLNVMWDKVGPDKGIEIHEQPITHALGTEPAVEGVPATLRLTANTTNFQWSCQNLVAL